MTTPIHARQRHDAGGIHVIHAYEYADATAREAGTFTAADIGKVAYQVSDASFWILVSTGSQWTRLVSSGSNNPGAGGGGGSGDPDATYVVMSATGSLNNERVLAVGAGLSLSDGGSGGNATLAVRDSIVATISGSTFVGSISTTGTGSFALGLSGSLTRLITGASFIEAGSNVTVVSSSNGSIVISSTATGGTGADQAASFVVIGVTSSLANERALATGSGVTLVDGGAGSIVAIGLDGSVARVSGSHFTGNISSAGTGSFALGLSGSLTRLVDGTSFIEAGTNIIVASSSNGSIIISSTAGGSGADISASYVVLTTTASLPNERAIAVGSGLTLTDAGAGSSLTVALDGTVARISGSHFTGNVSSNGTGSFALGISGSLTRLIDGTSFIEAGTNITIASSSNGSIVISSTATGGSGADVSASYVVLTATASLPNERALAAGSGLTLTDGGAGSSLTINLDGTVARVSGSHFTGNISSAGTGSFALGLSGSLTRLVDGTSFIEAGTNITVVSSSNGSIVISSTATGGTGADQAAQYVVLSLTASLPNERALTAGTAITITDGGAGGAVTVAADVISDQFVLASQIFG